MTRICTDCISEPSCIPYQKVQHIIVLGGKRINPRPEPNTMATQFSICSSTAHKDKTRKTNWDLCCLCQERTKEVLRTSSGGGYLTLATNIPEFYNLNSMPIPFDPKRLDEGDGILQTLEKNKAKFHESCRLKFNTSKLERKSKSSKQETEEVSPSKVTRSSHSTKSANMMFPV